MKCRVTNVVTTEGNIGSFRQWAAFGTTPAGYYAHMFVWEAQNSFSYLSAEETTADFVTWMFEHGKTISQSRLWRATVTPTTSPSRTTSTDGCAWASGDWASSSVADTSRSRQG